MPEHYLTHTDAPPVAQSLTEEAYIARKLRPLLTKEALAALADAYRVYGAATLTDASILECFIAWCHEQGQRACPDLTPYMFLDVPTPP